MGTCRVLSLAAVIPAVFAVSASAATIGINVTAPSTTGLAASAVAGIGSVAQSNWNNIEGWHGSQSSLVDSAGVAVSGLGVTWAASADWAYYAGQSWGFTGNNLTLMQGVFIPNSTITVTGIPYAQYDVYVYAEDGNGSGGVGSFRLATATGASGTVDPTSYYYRFVWNGGTFVKTSATTQADAAASSGSNYAVFTGNTANGFTLTSATNSWGGVSAIQIVDTTPIPEPAALGAVSLGLLVMLRRR